jgi:integrase
VGELLRALDAFKGSFQVACALRLAPLLFVRPGELRKARWADIDWDAQEWRFTASKTNTAHIVPLAPQALEILSELRPLTGHREFVFPGRDPSKPMSDAAMGAALRRLGFDTRNEVTVHGFRATARTLLDERLKFPAHIIEAQLAHAVRDSLGRAYNRTAFIAERHEMMAAWANYLDRLKSGAEVLPLRGAA